MITIHNMPAYAKDYAYIVASLVDGELWFYGAYNNERVAFQTALTIGGVVTPN